MKKTVPKPCYFLFLFSEQNSSIYNFILLNFLLKQNFLRPGLSVSVFCFLNFFQINILVLGVMFNENLKNVSIFKLIKTLQFCSFINFQQNTRN